MGAVAIATGVAGCAADHPALLAPVAPRNSPPPAASPPPSQAELPSRDHEACFGRTEPFASAPSFEAARALHVGGELERAGQMLLVIAHDSRSPDAPRAAKLLLEVMNDLGSTLEAPRVACYDVMDEEVMRLLDELCAPSPREGADEVCATMRWVAVDFIQYRAQRIIPDAERGP